MIHPSAYEHLVKAYDIRGLVPEEFDEAAAHTIGAAFVTLTGADRIAVARDMRGRVRTAAPRNTEVVA
ncbi:hypothetical protein [Streptomyces sp. ISL-86]|uniref:hypothetical protein n=1 Tax=Streptomyces sp. ISL-86 TaxID=2819187 RepID=UPI001BEB99E3|nr:hypothetical protein [Streptomyces sp. ISL-86]MBT2454434.1 hypothetical protein [Streptomyces sp. ISL-86]